LECPGKEKRSLTIVRIIVLTKGTVDSRMPHKRGLRESNGVNQFVDFWHTVEFSRIKRAPL